MAPSPTLLECDVLVAGGGSAGTAAAISAARTGADVLLIEETNCLGGVSTVGGVTEWFSGTKHHGDILDAVRAHLDGFGARFGRFFNHEYLKIAWQLETQKAGVRVLFHASVVGAHRDGAHVGSVDVISLGKQFHVRAKHFIDATGEGDLAFLAGADFVKGDPQTGRTLHMTLTAMMFDTGRPATIHLPEGLKPIESPDQLPGLNAHLKLPDGRVYMNMTKIMGHDPTDPFDLSRAELEARLQLVRIVHFLQRNHYPNHMIASTGARIGIREGRRIVGDYTLTRDDAIPGGTDFPDGVAVATCQIDFHSLTQPGHSGWRQRVQPYALPLRAMTARGIENLLVAGKCISGDQIAHSSYRMTATCVMMGHAVGLAAAMATKAGHRDIRNVDVAALRAGLTQQGMVLEPAGHQPFSVGKDTHLAPDEPGVKQKA